MFAYCVARLGFSEEAAYKRVGAARLVRDYPLVYELLSQGRVHLSAVILVKPYLTKDNHCEWLLSICGKSKRETERLVAARCPKPDVDASVRRLSAGKAMVLTSARAPALLSTTTCANLPAMSAAEVGKEESVRTMAVPSAPVDGALLAAPPTGASQSKLSLHPTVEPLSARSYRVVFTASEQLKDKLDRARDLLSHTVAPSDLPGLIERALDLLIAHAERRRFGAKHPRRSTSVATEQHKRRSRYVPANVRRAVWERDEGRCTYCDADGNRCEQRSFLQLDHREPFGLGGAQTAEVLRLRCAAHNALYAEESYGSEFIAGAIALSRARRAAK